MTYIPSLGHIFSVPLTIDNPLLSIAMDSGGQIGQNTAQIVKNCRPPASGRPKSLLHSRPPPSHGHDPAASFPPANLIGPAASANDAHIEGFGDQAVAPEIC